MSNFFKCSGTSLASAGTTTLLTAPAQSSFILSSVIISNTTSSAVTVTIDFTDSSAGSTYNIATDLSIGAKTKVELLVSSFVLEEGDSLKATPSTGGSMDVVISYLDRYRGG
jgi:endo-beta-N-acetylglucosaminidase D